MKKVKKILIQIIIGAVFGAITVLVCYLLNISSDWTSFWVGSNTTQSVWAIGTYQNS